MSSHIVEVPVELRQLLPKHAQYIYVEAYNNAVSHCQMENDSTEEGTIAQMAKRIAMAALKTRYEKGRDGRWHLKQVQNI